MDADGRPWMYVAGRGDWTEAYETLSQVELNSEAPNKHTLFQEDLK